MSVWKERKGGLWHTESDGEGGDWKGMTLNVPGILSKAVRLLIQML